MTEPDAQPALEADVAQQPEPFDPDRAEAKIKKANDEARALRQRLKELEPLAQEAERQREASKTAEQRFAETVTSAEQRASEAESRALRLEVAFEKGLTPAQAKRLVGASREELEGDADEILRDFPVKPDPRPAGDVGLGPRPVALSDNPRTRALQQIEADLQAGRK